jgi:hypothetical protein
MIEKALKYIRKNVDREEMRKAMCKAMEMRCPFSVAYPTLTDNIVDLLEEYGEYNDLPEGWWCEYGDIDDIIEML